MGGPVWPKGGLGCVKPRGGLEDLVPVYIYKKTSCGKPSLVSCASRLSHRPSRLPSEVSLVLRDLVRILHDQHQGLP